MSTAADRWREDLASWAIPDEILAQAPESPWIHPVQMFTVDADVPDSPSHSRAREALPVGGVVVDVGSGGGRASMALVPPAGRVVGVDEQVRMLERYAEAAAARGVEHEEHLGVWPEVAASVPVGDVVACHHVVYNVADLVPFAVALTAHARHRVVLELPTTHPLTHLAPYWRQFWDLERPSGPTADDCRDVLVEAGIAASLDEWVDDVWSARSRLDDDEQARFLRIRLCLPEERQPEVTAALLTAADPGPRRTATIWWDV
jgi:SAM-dependent methyltransferase